MDLEELDLYGVSLIVRCYSYDNCGITFASSLRSALMILEGDATSLQGPLVGSTLFLTYINDLLRYILRVKLLCKQ